MTKTFTRITITIALAAIAVAALALQPDAASAEAPESTGTATHQTIPIDPLVAVSGLASAGVVMASAAIGMRRR